MTHVHAHIHTHKHHTYIFTLKNTKKIHVLRLRCWCLAEAVVAGKPWPATGAANPEVLWVLQILHQTHQTKRAPMPKCHTQTKFGLCHQRMKENTGCTE